MKRWRMRRRGGFSLTELLMAMAVFSTLLVMALMILHWALRGSQAQEADTRAAFLAQAKMEELFSADKPENGSGGFPAPQNEYRWTDEVKSLPGEFLDIAVTITGPRGCLYALKSQRRLAHRELVYGSQGTLLQSSEDYHERIQVPVTGGSYSLGPDGVTLAYIDSYQGKPQIHTRRINDREGKVLFESPQGAQEPVWSPDGKKIAFTTQENGFSQVFVYDLKSGLSENRSQSNHHDGSPSWTPDGAGILFCRDSSSILVTAN